MFINDLSKLNLDTYNNSIPIFRDDNLSYVRDESDGYISCHSKKECILREIILNSTAKHILRYCNGNNTAEKILDNMNRDFKDVSKDRLKQDLISALYSLSIAKIIMWNGANPFMVNKSIEVKNNMKICVASEEDLENLVKFFVEIEESSNLDIVNYINPVKNYREYTDELIVREKLFSYKEEFFVLKNNESKIKGVISVALPVTNTITVAMIGVAIMPDEYIEESLSFIKDEIRNIAVEYVSKIKIHSIDIEKSKFIDIAKKSCFVKEGLLKNEIKEQDLEVYSYIY